MNCTRIKRIIDEADRPDVFPLEAARHVAGCPDCQSFADERARLRELTGSVARVTAPSNFNALLNDRLSRVKSQRSSWLSPAAFMRLGTATAGLVVVFMALQYGGFLSPKTPPVDQRPQVTGGGLPRDGSNGPTTPGQTPVVRESEHTAGIVRPVPRANNISTSRTPKDARQGGPPIFIVRDQNREVAVPMIPVSVGMQQQVLNASWGRQQTRSSDISY